MLLPVLPAIPVDDAGGGSIVPLGVIRDRGMARFTSTTFPSITCSRS